MLFRSNIFSMWPSKFQYDAFLSHAVEDKIPIANELCKKLENAGLRVWYSGKELRIGENLSQSILKALNESQYGIVVLSPAYMEKDWPRKEFYLLLAKENAERKVILPVLYNITNEDLKSKDIDIAGKWALSLDKGLDYVVEKLVDEIKGRKGEHLSPGIKTWFTKKAIAIATLCIFLVCTSYIVHSFYQRIELPSEELLEHTIAQRIKDLQHKIDKDHQLTIHALNSKQATKEEINNVYTNFTNLKTYYRNEYEFTNGYQTIRSKRNVEPALKINMESMSPYNSYNFTEPAIFLALKEQKGKIITATYNFANTQPLSYRITTSQTTKDGEYEVLVSYENNLRYITVNLLFPTGQVVQKKNQVFFEGFLPEERFVFHYDGHAWKLQGIEMP